MSRMKPSAGGVSVVRPARWRNVVIFIVGTVGLSLAACVAIAVSGEEPETSPLALVFIASPILMAAVLRWWGGDGWADAGLRPRVSGNGRWYALAVLLFPVLAVMALGLGAAAGSVTFSDDAGATLAAGFAAALVVRLVYSVFEEFGWRGYLEPRLANLGVPAGFRHVVVATVWGVWHVPYVVVFGSQSEVPLGWYLVLFMVAMVPMSLIYGVMTERSGSVWPAVLMHGVANAVAFPVLLSGAVTVDSELWFAARPEGLVTLAGLVGVSVAVWRFRGADARSAAGKVAVTSR